VSIERERIKQYLQHEPAAASAAASSARKSGGEEKGGEKAGEANAGGSEEKEDAALVSLLGKTFIFSSRLEADSQYDRTSHCLPLTLFCSRS